MDGLNSRVEGTEERSSDLKMEITQSEQQRENKLKEKVLNTASVTCGTITKDLAFMQSESPNSRDPEKEVGAEKY